MVKEIILVRTALAEEQIRYLEECLQDRFHLIQISGEDKDISEALCRHVRIIIVHELMQEELKRYPKLSFVQIYGRGTDKVCVEALKERGICYRCCLGKLLAESIAEYVLLQILYWERNMSILDDKGHAGMWTWEWRRHFQYRALKQLQVGVVGQGQVGCAVKSLLTNLGVKVCYINVGNRMEKSDIDLIGKMDYITLHLPLNQFTKGVIDIEFFGKMKPEAVFINSSRGKIVCEDHLAKALHQGIIRAASLDVTVEEPILRTSPLCELNNLIITPHIAGRAQNALMGHACEIVFNIKEEVWK